MRRLFRIETLFALGMWAVSLALAFFLIGLGGLVVADLPRVSDPVELEAFVDADAVARLEAERAQLASRAEDLAKRVDDASLSLGAAESDVAQQRGDLEAIVAARTATGDETRNEAVLRETAELEAARAAERQAREVLAGSVSEQTDVRARTLGIERDLATVRSAAAPAWQRARFLAELHVFGLRLALTLPLLAMGLWALRTRTNSPLWPLWRGFILFAAYAFFFELVPYLPSYGGYVHYGVGVATTLILGASLIRAARRHLARRSIAVRESEAARRAKIAYDDALAKTAKNTCPSCDRTLRTTDATPINYCVHCGLKLFEPCPSCGVRRLVFFPFCMSCGAEGAGEEPARLAQDALLRSAPL